MEKRGISLARAIVVVLAKSGDRGATSDEIMRELESLRRRGILREDFTVGDIETALIIGQATKLILNGNGRYKLNSEVKKDEFYWKLIQAELRAIYGREQGREELGRNQGSNT